MADPTTHRSVVRRGRVLMAHGRVVTFDICHYERFRKQKRWLVWWQETGKRYTGRRPLPEWFRTEDQALAAVRRRWTPVRGGLRYPERQR